MFCISVSRHVSMSVHVCVQVFTYKNMGMHSVAAMHLHMYAHACACLHMKVYMHVGCVHTTQRKAYCRIYPA